MARQLGPKLSASEGERDGRQHGSTGEECPLCEFEAADAENIYLHLQTSHRKSQIAKAVIDGSRDQETRNTDAEYRQFDDGRLRRIGDGRDVTQ